MKEDDWSAASEMPDVMANQSHQVADSISSTNSMLLAYMVQVVGYFLHAEPLTC
jgi:hypothetical protein